MDGQPPLIEFRNLRKSFGSQVVLDGVTLGIEQGKVTTIIGRSGVGKSVLLKHVVGLLTPDSGEVLYRGKNLFQMSRKERKALKSQFSYMFQSLALFDSMTVGENIALPLKEKTRLSKAEIRERVLAQMKQLELENIEDKYPSQLSGGMRKRVALARALITQPEIVLFDEPTTGLDPVRRAAVHNMIARYQGELGFTAIIVSHDIPEVFRISQKVAMLEKGRIMFEGTGNDILLCPDPVVRRFIEGDEEPDEEG
ncbi:MAG: ATP-binding cassette domain-containing protein [Candidatus Sumerlaeia bacterium]|nr:ATP-binding cassette domain-containing protein [Candidatus Sumerlaeia bacterium]